MACRRRERGPKDLSSFGSSTGTPRPVFVASTPPMAGLLARGSSPRPAFPAVVRRQWLNRSRLPAHSCGGSCGFGRRLSGGRTAFPIHPQGEGPSMAVLNGRMASFVNGRCRRCPAAALSLWLAILPHDSRSLRFSHIVLSRSHDRPIIPRCTSQPVHHSTVFSYFRSHPWSRFITIDVGDGRVVDRLASRQCHNFSWHLCCNSCRIYRDLCVLHICHATRFKERNHYPAPRGRDCRTNN